LADRHVVLTELRPMALQILPIVQGEKCVMPAEVKGFMIYRSPASQVWADKGQHCWELTVLALAQVCDVQSWTAP